jgi:DinB superfamily
VQTAPATELQPAVSLMEKTPFLLETLLGNLPAELLKWKPGPDRWSISEVLAHLADIEKVYSERIRRILSEDSPALQKYEQPGPSDPAAYSRGDAADHLKNFVAARHALITMLRGVPAAAGARTAKHSELGEITFLQLLNEWASHDLGHLRQIAEIYRAHAFHPHSGPFQRYSNLKP